MYETGDVTMAAPIRVRPAPYRIKLPFLINVYLMWLYIIIIFFIYLFYVMFE